MNKSSVDRGMFVSTYYRTYREQAGKNHANGEEEFFTKPDLANTKNLRPFCYDKLADDGFVPENMAVDGNDVIIGRCMPQKLQSAIINKDTSVALKNSEHGFIDRNAAHDKYFINVNGDGYTFAKVRIRSDRVPSIGDKFSSVSGQKGTIGMLYRQEEMPFSPVDGLVPDIIINPHAIPSRMTIGQLLETLTGLACCARGTHGDGTPFMGMSLSDVTRTLEEQCGMQRFGDQILHDPRTGRQLHTQIFIGPCFYQRLKHMVVDKLHSRSQQGPVVLLTRQPAEGRARDGGLRLGEMEVECLQSHGIMGFLKERMQECSDGFKAHICRKCGHLAVANPQRNIFDCQRCKNKVSFSEIRIPYALKLLVQEVETMGIGTRFMV